MDFNPRHILTIGAPSRGFVNTFTDVKRSRPYLLYGIAFIIIALIVAAIWYFFIRNEKFGDHPGVDSDIAITATMPRTSIGLEASNFGTERFDGHMVLKGDKTQSSLEYSRMKEKLTDSKNTSFDPSMSLKNIHSKYLENLEDLSSGTATSAKNSSGAASTDTSAEDDAFMKEDKYTCNTLSNGPAF